MQYIVIISLIIVLCVSIYLSSFKQIESFETEDEQTENYLRQYKRKLDTLKELLTEYAKQAENNLLSAKATQNKTTIRSLATKNTNLLEAVKIINQLPLIIFPNRTMNEPGFTVEDFENTINDYALIDNIKKKIKELEANTEEDDEEEEEDTEEDDEDINYEKVAALEKASEDARLAEEEAKRIRMEEEVRLAEETKKQTLLTAKNDLKIKMNELDRAISEGIQKVSTIDKTKLHALQCKINQRIDNLSMFFDSSDPNFAITDYNVKHKTNMHGFKDTDVYIEINPSTQNWDLLKFFSASSANNVILEGKLKMHINVSNPLDDVFPPLIDPPTVYKGPIEAPAAGTAAAQTVSPGVSGSVYQYSTYYYGVAPTINKNPVLEQYKGTYIPHRGVDNAIYRMTLLSIEFIKVSYIINYLQSIMSGYDYKKLVSDIENVEDDIDKIQRLTSIVDNKISRFINVFNEIIGPFLDNSPSSRLYRYAWYIMFPYNWEDYYLNNYPVSNDLRNNLFCCNLYGNGCVPHYPPSPASSTRLINWTFYLRKVQ